MGLLKEALLRDAMRRTSDEVAKREREQIHAQAVASVNRPLAATWAAWKADALSSINELRGLDLGSEEIYETINQSVVLTERQQEFLVERLQIV